MSDEVYRRLAERLDQIPNGFPSTESGIELRLLARIFTPQEAALGAELRLRYEAAETIAPRLDMDPGQAYQVLKGMARKGLVRARRGEGKLEFALLPFVVGIYEEQLPRMDAELASLAEAYFREIAGRTILDTAPAIHRVVPVQEAIPVDLEVFPYQRAAAIVEEARSWGVRDCICRVQRRLIGEGCDHPVEACLVMAPVENVFAEGGITRPIDKEEALELLRQAAEAGLVHSTGNFRDGHHYICNCCSCCCAVLRGLVEFDVPTAVARSGFQAAVERDLCLGCGICLERCPFAAVTLEGETATVDVQRCLGCGLCVTSCTAGALRLERREETEKVPADIKEWMAHRGRSRELRLEDIL